MIADRLCTEIAVEWTPDLRPYKIAALLWQRRSAHAKYSEFAGAERGRLYEVFGLMASIGEQFGLACTCVREFRSWIAAPPNKDEDGAVGDEMAKRAVSELLGHFVIGVAHSLFNTAARTVAIDINLHPELAKRFRTSFPPLAGDRSHWLTFNKTNTDQLRRVARKSKTAAVRAVADPVYTFARTDAWARLDELRGEDFHRWRPQSAGIAGVEKHQPWIPSSDGESHTLTIGLPTILGADGNARLADTVFEVAMAALEAELSLMDEFDEVFVQAINATTNLTLDRGDLKP